MANKQDAGSVWQRYIVQPDQFCLQHKLPPPHPYSSVAFKRDIYTKLATMAAYPCVTYSSLIVALKSHCTTVCFLFIHRAITAQCWAIEILAMYSLIIFCFYLPSAPELMVVLNTLLHRNVDILEYLG